MTLRPIEYAPAAEDSTMPCYLHFPPHRADWIAPRTSTLGLCDEGFKRLRDRGFTRAADSHEAPS